MALSADIFSPRAANGPSGFGDRPRPFVLRAAALEGQRFDRGERFTLGVNAFLPAFQKFRQTFERVKWPLVEARELAPVSLALAAEKAASRGVSGIKVRFLTPTELKDGGEVLREPRFDVLLKRARDRISALCALYQGGAPEADYQALGDSARAVTLTSSHIEDIAVERLSSRTGQTHSIGGFIGEADYEGDLTPFIPWLEAAGWTGVGRLTVWGNGWISTEYR